MIRIAVLADTHIPRRAKALPEAAWEVVRSADVIVHAGDVLTEKFLGELRKEAPVHAVRGNNDIELEVLQETIELSLEGVNVAVIHDSGGKTGRQKRMRKRFPKADIVIFGHSHVPMNEETEGLLLFNPGSPTDKRMQPVATMGLIEIDNGKVKAQIVELPK
jgi:putative phosphoesterase